MSMPANANHSDDTATKPRVAPVRTNNNGELICPGCGQPHLTSAGMSDDGPEFVCSSCSVMPTLSLMSNDTTTKMFWTIG